MHPMLIPSRINAGKVSVADLMRPGRLNEGGYYRKLSTKKAGAQVYLMTPDRGGVKDGFGFGVESVWGGGKDWKNR